MITIVILYLPENPLNLTDIYEMKKNTSIYVCIYLWFNIISILYSAQLRTGFEINVIPFFSPVEQMPLWRGDKIFIIDRD